LSNYILCPAPDLATKERNFANWENGFSEDEISNIRKLGDSLATVDATIGSDDADIVTNEFIRKSKTAWIPCTEKSQFIYDKIGYIARQLNGQFFELDLYGFVEDLQYTVYNGDGGHYNWHMDKGLLNGAPRKLSLVLQLSDPTEYEGGDLEFFVGSEPIKAEKAKGIVYAFPSYIMHRVTPVTAGTRKSLVVWLAGKKFQ
jgi:PKHD-type hydroxylase